MNTASFDYAVLNDSVGAELESLRAEKQLLEENIRTTEKRLSEISLREEKLARLSDSLTDLLTTYPENTTIQPTLPLAESEKTISEETAAVGEPNETAVLRKESALADAGNKDLPDSEAAFPAQTSALETEPEAVVPKTTAIAPREFNREEFFENYPHLKGAQQPIHVLAEKLLEYLGRPMKLRDLTDYILKLGYRHHSQNFTNTVHTVLKNKRDRSGSFYFDPKERMWELGHWRSIIESTMTVTPKRESINVENRADQQSFQPAQSESVKVGETESLSGKKAKQSKIKVIKASSRNG